MNNIIEKPWRFISDGNGDGIITIGDVLYWLIWIFFLPGDSFLYCIMTKFPSIARFFEISSDNFHGFLSAIFSFIVWCIFFCIISVSQQGTPESKREATKSIQK